MSTPHIACHFCEGKGRLPLSLHLSLVLNRIPRRGSITALQLLEHFDGVEHRAMCNRLADLFNLNLVTRERDGKQWFYTRK